MIDMCAEKKSPEALIKREVFKSGEYRHIFNPEDRWNPFHKIYSQKKGDTIRIIQGMSYPLQLLDIGGGYGRLSLALLHSAQNRIVLADISMDMLRQARRNVPSSNTFAAVNTDAHELPFQSRSFNLVVGLDLFCHLERPENALVEFHRILRNDGILILDSTNSNPLWTLFYPRYLGKNPIGWVKTFRNHGVCPGWEAIVTHYPKEQFFSLVRVAGFRIVKNINYGPRMCPKWHLIVANKVA